MDEFIKDRDEAFASGDIEKVRTYCKKYDIEIPEDDTYHAKYGCSGKCHAVSKEYHEDIDDDGHIATEYSVRGFVWSLQVWKTSFQSHISQTFASIQKLIIFIIHKRRFKAFKSWIIIKLLQLPHSLIQIYIFLCISTACKHACSKNHIHTSISLLSYFELSQFLYSHYL